MTHYQSEQSTQPHGSLRWVRRFGIPSLHAAFVRRTPQRPEASSAAAQAPPRSGPCAPKCHAVFAPPCGHFASLVRSVASRLARVPSEAKLLRRILRPLKRRAHLRSHPPRTVCGWKRRAVTRSLRGNGGGRCGERDARHGGRASISIKKTYGASYAQTTSVALPSVSIIRSPATRSLSPLFTAKPFTTPAPPVTTTHAGRGRPRHP